MRAMRRAMIVATAGAMAFMFGSCSNSKGGCDTNPMGPGCTTTTTTTQPVQTRSVIRTDSCTGIGVNFLCFFDPLTTSQRGDMDVTVDWTFPEDSIQVMVSNGPCTLEQINASTCPMIGTSTASNLPKPRLLTIKGVAAGTYQLYVGNRGPKTESVSIQVGLTTPGTASASTSARRESAGGPPYTSQVAAH